MQLLEACADNFKLKAKTSAIRNGIHLDKLPKIINHLHLQENKKNLDLIIIARMVEQKNVFRLLSVLEKTTQVKSIEWYGEGVLNLEIISFIKNSSLLKKKIKLCGVIPR